MAVNLVVRIPIEQRVRRRDVSRSTALPYGAATIYV
jgi:hypothetical protein